MTSLAFILGCLPLALSVGAGAASRHSIGTGIVGGMLAATGIAIFFVPSFFSIIMRLTSKEDSTPEKDKKSLSEEEKTALDPTSEGGVN
ncbi:Multidrug resistance protein MdtB [bioreactor metagenome]|uniref:Multidrug resistance protein MdtB n=1 Tax=bioreactor metagenome TaxID=1076179 RepID=A0A645IXS8_9ZZZZ